MSVKDFTYSGKVSNITSLDYYGQKLGLYRGPNETLENFKERCYCCFRYPSNGTNEGQSAIHTRAMNQYVKNIGYIKISPDYRIYFNGYGLIVYFADSEAKERVKVLEYKLTDHVSIEQFKNDFENLNENNLVILDDLKYLTKDLCFLFPFGNYGTERIPIRSGTTSLAQTLNMKIIPESLRSNTNFIKNRLLLGSDLTKEGDYIFNEESGNLIVYEDLETSNTDFLLIYNYYMTYVPIWYSPIASYQTFPIVLASNNIVDINNDEFSTFGAETDSEILDIAFTTKLINAGWKNSQAGAESVSGTYYDK